MVRAIATVSFFILCSVLVASGCNQRPTPPVPKAPTRADFDRVTEGMTVAEVEAILGDAHNITVKADMPEEVQEKWKEDIGYWGGRRTFGVDVRVYFKDGKVTRKEWKSYARE